MFKPMRSMAVVCLVSMMGIAHIAAAVEIDIKDRAHLENTKLAAGSDAVPIATTRPQGAEGAVTYQWELDGVGSLGSRTDSGTFYTPPASIDGETQVTISVRVTDANGDTGDAQVTVTIVGGNSENGEPIFSEDFENGRDSLRGWELLSSKIEVVDCGEYGKCAKISRTDRNGSTILTKIFRNYSGTLRFEVMVKSENVVKGQQSFESGKLSVVVEDHGNQDWTKAKFYTNDFDGSFNWRLITVEAIDLDGTKDTKLVTGLQSAKGVVYIDNIKVYHLP